MPRASWLSTLIERALQGVAGAVEPAGDWRPTAPDLCAALDALEADHCHQAVALYGQAVAAGHAADELRVVHEVITSSLANRCLLLDGEMEQEQRISQTAAGEISLLALRLERLRFRRQPRLIWLTVASAIAIVGSTLISITQLRLPRTVGLGGLLLFGCGALLLLTVDRRRQHAAFERKRTAMRAEVAEESQILRVEIGRCERRLTELEGSRQSLQILLGRLEEPRD